MIAYRRFLTSFLLAAIVALLAVGSRPATAASAADIDRQVANALQRLYAGAPETRKLAGIAKGVLVFPGVVKGGLVVGGQYGAGALRVKGKTAGYYNLAGLSYGLQAGAQTFDYALFFMTDAALDYLKNTRGWEIGVGPTVVVADKGMAASLSTTTAKNDVYAFIYGQKGLMAGIGLQGAKITEIHPDK